MRRTAWHAALAAGLVLALANDARSQAAAPDVPATGSVRVAGLKDPGLLPYKKVYTLLAQAEDVGNGHVDVVVRAVSAATRAPVPGLDIVLAGDTLARKLDVSADGIVAVPRDAALEADHADFMSNKKKGELLLDVALVPKLPHEKLSYGDIVDSIDAARRVLAATVPWYQRALSSTISKVGICFGDERQAVQVANAARPALVRDTDRLTGATLYCAGFTRSEAGVADDSVIAPAPGWQAVFL